MNIEHANIEAESLRDEDHDEQPTQFEDEQIREAVERLANQRAQKYLKKHGKEIKRLKKHCEKCLLEDNYEGYAYALKKLRDHYRQPYNEVLIRSMWAMSRRELVKIVEHAKSQQ